MSMMRFANSSINTSISIHLAFHVASILHYCKQRAAAGRVSIWSACGMHHGFLDLCTSCLHASLQVTMVKGRGPRAPPLSISLPVHSC
mmetsp:Transcript_40831/g.107877  ORF Transcript_40831/g.107877 Transcript_40831/m.107877 type:complete len:88 (-) Transcript_40831:915-1178(-)